MIIQTYTEVFGGDDADYELEQIAKLSVSAKFAQTAPATAAAANGAQNEPAEKAA